MKKRKILIPALAVLAFSTVASVTGTVAWFTSQSSVTINTSKFSITGLDANLGVKGTKGAGTTIAGTGKDTVISAATVGSKTNTLTHGSFDIESKKVFSIDQFTKKYTNKTGAHLGSGMVESDFMENTNTQQYNAFTWSLTFTYGNGENFNETTPVNLYFDVDSVRSQVESDTAPVDGDANACRAFRIAMLERTGEDTDGNPLYGGQAMVWSPLQFKNMGKSASNVSTDPASSHIGWIESDDGQGHDTSHWGVVPYDTTSDGELVYRAQTDLPSLVDVGAGPTTRTDCLGQFTSENKGNLTIDFVAWFEGCDEMNVSSDVSLRPAVSAKMSFFVRSDNTPTE